MSMMNAELYDALLDAGAVEEKARAASQAVGDLSQLATKADIDKRLNKVEADINLLRWMIGFNLALTAAILLERVFS